MKIKLLIEYDGFNYYGWQKQVGVPSIQSTVEKAIIIYLKSEFKKQSAEFHTSDLENFLKLVGSGRTDAGVHARGQVAAFYWPDQLIFDDYKFLRGINGLIPEDIAIKEAVITEENFHPRISAVSKTYSYLILNRVQKPVLELGHVWHVKKISDFLEMQRGAKLFLGEHDFKSFRASDCNAKTSTRTIYQSILTQEDNEVLKYQVCGNGFLKNQVRFMLGSLVALGKGQISYVTLEDMIRGADRVNFEIAPACGLTLEKVNY